MKLLKWLPVLMVFVCWPALSQNKVLDSLNNQFNKATTAKEKAGLLNLIAGEYESDPASMMQFAKKGLAFAQKNKLKEQEADAWLNIGNANVLLSKYTDALKSFTRSQDIYEGILKVPANKKNKEMIVGLANAYGSIGVVCSEQNNYPKALEYYFKALKLYTGINSEHVVAFINNNIGIVYESQKEYDKALQYFNKALIIQEKLGDETTAVTVTNIGNIYFHKNNEAKALELYKEAEKQLIAFNNKRGLTNLYNNLGDFYKRQNNFADAERYYLDALNIIRSTGEKFGESVSLLNLGVLYGQQKKRQAVEYLTQSSNLAKEIGVLKQVEQSEKALSEYYENIGNTTEALEHYKKYTDVKDEIVNGENVKNLIREEINYEFERKASLQKLEDEKKQALYTEESKRHKQQMLFLGIFVLLIFGITFSLFSRLQLKKRLTLQRDLAEYEQKALHLQMNPHFVFNCLGSISSFIVQNGTDSAIKYLSKFSKLMRLTLEYSKESLIPIDREIEGLQNYLELEQLRFNRVFEFSITKDPNIEDDMGIPPLLLQPFVENAIIHGIVPKKENGTISVDFSLDGEKLVCTVTDDGIGIDQSRKNKEKSVTVHKSMALEITRKRLEVIQAVTSKTAQVEIKEIKDTQGRVTGTRIVLNLPIQYATN
ncbi:tetratricopeptide repeat protein [Flavobacterium zepuense]|uniref:Tetratricopeptide repeat protein n=1 Tax=Flavobacterium zepuense TaxID=2593302 RepID=A0A552V775_9FLAO|nr:tetratricopeptide repeat protein [Flavobacterium zepuense]TRW26326.1 tetratricopeptide repeat protein [Flavobacterium zepuense]